MGDSEGEGGWRGRKPRREREEGGKGAASFLRMLVGCCFTPTETVGLLGTGAQDVHLDFHTAPELCLRMSVSK